MNFPHSNLDKLYVPLANRTMLPGCHASAKWANWLKFRNPVQGPPASVQASWPHQKVFGGADTGNYSSGPPIPPRVTAIAPGSLVLYKQIHAEK